MPIDGRGFERDLPGEFLNGGGDFDFAAGGGGSLMEYFEDFGRGTEEDFMICLYKKINPL